MKYRAALEKLNKKITETELSCSSVSSDDIPPSPKTIKEDLPTVFVDEP